LPRSTCRIGGDRARSPQEIKNTGVTITKANPNFVFAAGFYSPDNSLSNQYISNYLDVYVKDALKRIPGVGDVVIFGERKYAMRIWLDPTKLASRQLTAADVVTALQEQNVEIPAGQLGRPPADPKQTFQVTLRVIGRLSDPKEFENIIIKNTRNGIVQLKEVGRAEIGAESYDTNLLYSGHEATASACNSASNANALQVDKLARRRSSSFRSPSLPASSTSWLRHHNGSGRLVKEVVTTLEEAVAIVIIIFPPFGLACHHHPSCYHSGIAHLRCFHQCLPFFHQFVNAFWDYSRDRAGGRRRHRRYRKCAAAHQPGQDRFRYSHVRGHEGSVQRCCGNFVGADFGVCAGVVFSRHYRNSLPAILIDHRILDRHLAVQCAYFRRLWRPYRCGTKNKFSALD
jgi:hypothetical protein